MKEMEHFQDDEKWCLSLTAGEAKQPLVLLKSQIGKQQQLATLCLEIPGDTNMACMNKKPGPTF